ncbi:MULTISPECIES: carbohydrate ABC transporter permease [Enterococcus]|uniref:Multiple sugar transport system permease n=1 Tax=Candidatus Enterococcus ferrettii TaxID=2815324 RepID=A0ABV0EU76_9ENTE|nr:carbohydrate ABC transporter permease [Enterococcus sp. 665A]
MKKSKVGIYLLAILLSIYCLFPFLWMLISSLKPINEIRATVPTFIIKSPTFENFQRVLFDAGFVTYIKNSLIVSTISCLISLVISICAGYVFSRFFRLRIVKFANLFMLLSQMIPGVLLLVPLYIIMRNLRVLDSYISLILAYTTFVIPMCTFMMSSFFDSVPKALEEAAEIDGYNRIQILFKIILPISLPTIISTGLYAFINAWNEFMFGYIFISREQYRTLTPAIMLFKGTNTVDWGALMAASVIALIPVTVLFLFLQRYFIAGLASGSVKG